MRATNHAPPSVAPPNRELRPLTQSTTEGVPYVRFPDIEAEIRRMLGLDPASWDPEELKSEVLVCLIRVLAKEKKPKHDDVLGNLFDQLGRHVLVIARDYTSSLSRAVREEVEDRVQSRVIELVFADKPTRGSEYLEMVFREKIIQVVLRELKRAKRQPNPRQFVSLDAGPGSNDTGVPDQTSQLRDPGPGPEDELLQSEIRELLEKGLQAITDDRHRQAVLLRYEEGWPIRDSDPSIPTLSKHFDVSPRQINNWLNTAVNEMRKATGEET